jgi:protein SCO1/2
MILNLLRNGFCRSQKFFASVPSLHSLSRMLLLVLFLLLGAACSTAEPPAGSTGPQRLTGADGLVVIQPPIVTDFTLIDQDGHSLELASLRGNAVLMAFGYTHCPDVCPVTLARFRQVKDTLGADAERVKFVFVSVDGERDTPEHLKGYLTLFDAGFVGLTTPDEELARQVIGQFGGGFDIKDAGGLRANYTVDHTASSFLIDPAGGWTREYPYNYDPALMAADILTVLQQTS